ncbi:stage V sporulation protein T [Mahella australiensis]|uniref:Transcriptional regulator, AbrB family n=1 Tax=Mahella australiensis (strain DSM 15567 / CIP 107919 / 50-1 BON) TaxID=697281 RepID=F4A1G4_MAHA5|nr:stage V sporulation protein T [Mahella australiensis]AEE95998.1 transcriptional regulator, AbrB family [Mahella australiensis 50-1 BON]
MKATGIVRRIDDLGRVVIPKEIRRTLRIREGDPLEIFTDKEGGVILRKYSFIGELNDFAKEYADTISQILGHIVCIADKDNIIAVSGAAIKKDLQDKRISSELEQIITGKEIFIADKNTDRKPCSIVADDEAKYTAELIAPIVTPFDGKGVGAVILLSKEPNAVIGESDIKVARSAADFLAKQMQG